MKIQPISKEDVQGFIDCYICVFKTLYNILPEDYINTQIEQASHPEFYSKLRKAVDDHKHILLVSRDHNNIVGMAWGNITTDGSSWLGFMGVIQSHRRRGIGRHLLNRFIEESRKRGTRKISLDTDPRLVPAIQLYESSGFIQEGSVTNPYGLGLILYSKHIMSSHMGSC